jgi:NADH:ubiquinone reductase (non-electrogenic)
MSPFLQVPYDMLVVAVGSVNNTFGIKGVKEHTLSFRGIRDATALRRQVSECFERAALPHTPPEVHAASCSQPRHNNAECHCANGGCRACPWAPLLPDMADRSDEWFEQERKKLLSFVIVGGGPTGVEVAAELHDMIRVRWPAVQVLFEH